MARFNLAERCASARGTRIAAGCAMLRHFSSGPFHRIRSSAFPSWRAALYVGCIASFSIACGGKSDSDVFEDGGNDGTGGTASGGTGGTAPTGDSTGSGGSNSTGGGDGSTSATNGSSSNVTSGVTTTGSSTTGNATTGSSTTGTGTTGSGGGPHDDRCQLPIEPGPCDGAFEAYGYDTETGRCEKFIYGGCEGNDNRFDTITECLGLCEPAGLACEKNSDCAIDHDCCGPCNIQRPDQLVAVNAKYATFAAPHCLLLDCAYCPPSDEIGNFGARCNEGTCEVYDVRKSDLSACEVDADCRLRLGLGCCESCGGSAWVAVSTDHERVHKELCGDMDVACPACEPIYPEDLGARCGSDGHCYVASLL